MGKPYEGLGLFGASALQVLVSLSLEVTRMADRLQCSVRAIDS